jgi:hypothetical protein
MEQFIKLFKQFSNLNACKVMDTNKINPKKPLK